MRISEWLLCIGRARASTPLTANEQQQRTDKGEGSEDDRRQRAGAGLRAGSKSGEIAAKAAQRCCGERGADRASGLQAGVLESGCCTLQFCRNSIEGSEIAGGIAYPHAKAAENDTRGNRRS